MERRKTSIIYRIISCFIAISFTFTSIVSPSFAQIMPQTVLNLPAPGTMLPVSSGYHPPVIAGIQIDPDNPMRFGFIVNPGDADISGDALKNESTKLIKYFLASLTVPEDQLWVNLSPYEKGRMVSKGLGDTIMGRDMLAQDYLLKQLTTSLMYPEDELGNEFWQRVHKKAYERFGVTDIPLNTFNKVWIVPQNAKVYIDYYNVYVVDSHLKVMMEEDYLALNKNLDNEKRGTDTLLSDDVKAISGVSSEVIREILIPEIEREVNEGKNFANLRQIFNSLILAVWYKRNLKENLLGQIYMDQNKTKGIDSKDKTINQKIYDQYVEAFKKGAYSYIKEEFDPLTQELIPRQYISGGVSAAPGEIKQVGRNRLGEPGDPAVLAAAGGDALESSGGAHLVEGVFGAAGETGQPGTERSEIRPEVDEVIGVISEIGSGLERRLGSIAGVEGHDPINETLSRRNSVIQNVLIRLRADSSAENVAPTLIQAVADLDPVKDINLREGIVRAWADFTNARAANGFAEADMAAEKERRRTQAAKIPVLGGIDLAEMPSVQEYVDQELDLSKGNEVFVVDASNEQQIQELYEQGLVDEIIYERDLHKPGNPTSYGSHSHPADTARAIGPTKNTSRNPNDKSFYNNWHDSQETLIKQLAASIGLGKGKRIYVIASVAGHPEKSSAFPLVQLTDSLAIVFQYLTLYNLGGKLIGRQALDKIKRNGGNFLKISHLTGNLDLVRRAGDVVIEYGSGGLRKMDKSKRFRVHGTAGEILANLLNSEGKLVLLDSRIPEDAEALSTPEFRDQLVDDEIFLQPRQQVHVITDKTDDRMFNLYTNESTGTGDFVDQYGTEEVRLIKSIYGGNGIGAKKFVLRLAIIKAMRSKGLGMAHAYLTVFRNRKTGETYGIMGRFPSLVGKSNAALGEVADILMDEWENFTIADDLVMEDFKILSDGEAIDVETASENIPFDEVVGYSTEGGGFFVAPGSNRRELGQFIEASERGGGLSINLAYRYYVDPVTGRRKISDEWWKNHDNNQIFVQIVEEFFQARRGELPDLTGWHDWNQRIVHVRLNGIIPENFTDEAGLIDRLTRYLNAKNKDEVDITIEERSMIEAILKALEGLSHPNARYSVRNETIERWIGNVDTLLPEGETIEGADLLEHRIDIDEVSGRRPYARTMPIVRLVSSTIAGLYDRMMNWSETTAAEEGKEGTLVLDSDAIKPFLPARIGQYIKHQMDRAFRLKPGARLTSVIHPFLKDKDQFVFPGFRENSRIRIWEITLLIKLRELIRENEGRNVLEDVEFLRNNLDPNEYQVTELGIIPTKDSFIFEGMNLSEEARIRLTSIDISGEYAAEDVRRNTRAIINDFRMDVPDAMRREHERRAELAGVDLEAEFPEWYEALPWEEMQRQMDGEEVASGAAGKFAALGKNKMKTGAEAAALAESNVDQIDVKATSSEFETLKRGYHQLGPIVEQLERQGRRIVFSTNFGGHALTRGDIVYLESKLVNVQEPTPKKLEAAVVLIQAALANELKHNTTIGDTAEEFSEELAGLKAEARILYDRRDLHDEILSLLQEIHEDLDNTITDELLKLAERIAKEEDEIAAIAFISAHYPEHTQAARAAMTAIDQGLEEAFVTVGSSRVRPIWARDHNVVSAALRIAQLIVGGIYIRSEEGSARAPIIVTDELLAQVSREQSKVIVDVAIDQGGPLGGNIEFQPASGVRHAFTPERFAQLDRHGNLVVAVPNMPTMLRGVSAQFLSEVTVPYLIDLISNDSAQEVLARRPELVTGLSVVDGEVLDGEVARVHGYDFKAVGRAHNLQTALDNSKQIGDPHVIGVPTEIKAGENRVGITPSGVAQIKQAYPNVRILIQRGAGAKSDFSDEIYEREGAEIVDDVQTIWNEATIIMKVKEPQPSEFERFKEGQIVYAYFHNAGEVNRDLVAALVEKKVTALAYESVTVDGTNPLLMPMSKIAGWIAAIMGAILTRSDGNYAELVDESGIIRSDVVREFYVRFNVLYNYMRENIEALRDGTLRFPDEVLDQAGVLRNDLERALMLGGGNVGSEAAFMSLTLGAFQAAFTELDETAIMDLEGRLLEVAKRNNGVGADVVSDGNSPTEQGSVGNGLRRLYENYSGVGVSYRQLVSDARLSRTTIAREIDSLERLKLVRVERHPTGNLVRLTDLARNLNQDQIDAILRVREMNGYEITEADAVEVSRRIYQAAGILDQTALVNAMHEWLKEKRGQTINNVAIIDNRMQQRGFLTSDQVRRLERTPNFRQNFSPITDALNELLGSNYVAGQGWVVPSDYGQEAVSDEAPGGIDLNPEYLDMQILRDSKGIPLPLEQQPVELMQIEGIVPIIINVTPINVPMILGLADEAEEETDVGMFGDLDPAERKARFDLNENDHLSYLN